MHPTLLAQVQSTHVMQKATMNYLLNTLRTNKVASLGIALLIGLIFHNVYGIAKHIIFTWTQHFDFGSLSRLPPESQSLTLALAFNLAIDLASSLITAAFCGVLLVYIFRIKARILCPVSIAVFLSLNANVWSFWKYPELGMRIGSLMEPIMAGLVFVSVVLLMVKMKNRLTLASRESLATPLPLNNDVGHRNKVTPIAAGLNDLTLKGAEKMSIHDLSKWQHDHVFDTGNQLAERGAKAVMWITLVMMVIEIAGGWRYNSMALLADGWHMSSHALALGLSAFAYVAARHYARDPRFAFGTWKIEILAGYTSAILLVCVAAIMLFGSLERILSPKPIHYQEAILVAAIGLSVNLLCAYILGDAHHHSDHNHHHGGHDHQHHDLNLKSAYLHVIADAATSVLAIAALVGGWLYGWIWLDLVMGIVGAGLIIAWARGLIVETGKVLLDREMDHEIVKEIREVIESDLSEGDSRLADLHVWRVGKEAYSAALVIVTHDSGLTPERVRSALSIHEEIVHVTVEINQPA
jgi:cation diffusion facilitator family transporter